MKLLKDIKNIAKNLTVLYVEDDIELRNSVKIYLEKLFASIVTKENGEEGLNEYKKNSYDIVITDIRMPKMDGLTMAREIKKIKQSQDIIIISAYSSIENYIESIHIGVEGYILKPIDYDQMNQVLYKISNKLHNFYENEEYKTNLEKMVETKTNEALKLLEEQKKLVYQSKLTAISQLISAIAHQWRQPINAVGILVQEIELKYTLGRLDEYEMSNLSNKLQSQLEYMSTIIENFRNFFSQSKEEVEFDIKASIENTIDLIKDEFENNNIKLKLLSNDNEYLIRSNQNEFRQAILNILINAKEAIIEHTLKNKRDEKEIVIEILKDNENFIIKISDNGGGIDKSIINEIFDAYVTSKINRQGMGIGLYITKIIVEEHMKGKISAQNTKDGALFEILLPNK